MTCPTSCTHDIFIGGRESGALVRAICPERPLHHSTHGRLPVDKRLPARKSPRRQAAPAVERDQRRVGGGKPTRPNPHPATAVQCRRSFLRWSVFYRSPYLRSTSGCDVKGSVSMAFISSSRPGGFCDPFPFAFHDCKRSSLLISSSLPSKR